MTPRTHPARLAATAVALLLAFGAAACGTSSGETSSTTEGKTTTTADGSDDTTTTEADDETPTTEDDDETTTTEGSDDPVDADAQAYVDAMTDGVGEVFGGTERAACLAEAWVDTIGADVLTEKGVTPEEFGEGSDDMIDGLGLDEDTASDLYDTFGDCDIDLRALFTSFGSDDPTPEQEACVEEILTDDALRASFVAEYTGESLDEDPVDEIDTCFPDLDDGPEVSAETLTPQTVTPGN